MDPGFITLNLNTLLTTIIAGLVVWGVKRSNRGQDAIQRGIQEQSDKIGVQNGRITKLETWKDEHKDIHRDVREDIQNLWGDIGKLRDK